ncbi:hypothetical protein P175DRAFT_0484041 [Aspergillus ochraceoroseus IBT 24754]|uniref:C2H2-type domain-containing protein n=1 Tax=Aspergillus ochraceoroseus IBT 24754 TaxID=1392256 RepID=A0A2T5LQW9_9EURO|nr:uncharacterized protein P175DRAFT_0484041 [Aspergillus ochraceoroseus IBT 24754]PTU18684.1 hypothetical protein P175DRAFT_0484041 [Aspergillus ochraceoroseus IBT 24754]
METAEPVSYEFPGHAVGAVARGRMMNSNLNHNFSFYANPTTSFPLPYQSSSTTYGFGHTLNNHHHHHHHHHPGYQHYFVHNQPPINPQPVRLSSEPPTIQPIPDIRPAKNAISRVAREQLPKVEHNSGSKPVSAAQTSANSVAAQGKNANANEVEFSTEVDILMKAIQAKGVAQPAAPMQSLPPLQRLTHPVAPTYSQPYIPPAAANPRSVGIAEDPPSRSGKKRKYVCTLPQCGKSFAQKTHLDIHMRAHTGDKPFICKEPSCGQRFSQLGNLKTHQRRHTGEKPFSCDICQKRFAQRGNVRAHKITHQHAKPFSCLLDDCGKQFTQLGNLKSHQNKFHATTLRNLTLRFSQVVDGDHMNPQDRKLWEYFATLYKNSNKGIKGRGKDRRISPTSKSDPGSDARRRAAGGLNGTGTGKNSGDDKPRRASYEDSSTYTGGSSSEEEDAEPYYIDRQGSLNDG